MGKLDAKVALITGTAGGQGRAASLAFAAEGARVFGCDLNVEGNEATVAAVKAQGYDMDGLAPVDLGDPADAQRLVEECVSRFGGIDIVYNNASAARFVPFGEMGVDDWAFTIRNELDLVFYVSRFAWPYLAQRPGAVVINTASAAGMMATKTPGAAHAAAKGGVIALTRQMALEGGPLGIRLSISPGPIQSPGTAEHFARPEVRAEMQASTMLARVGEPEEVARIAVFLASDDASFVTGADIPVDAGMTAK